MKSNLKKEISGLLNGLRKSAPSVSDPGESYPHDISFLNLTPEQRNRIFPASLWVKGMEDMTEEDIDREIEIWRKLDEGDI